MGAARRLATSQAGMIDVHTHAIDPDLADVSARFPGVYPTVQRTSEDTAQIWLDGRMYREIDSRCWSAADRVRDMDAEGVAMQVVSPIPVTLSHSEPADGAAALAEAQNNFLAKLVEDAPGRLAAFGCVPLQSPRRAIAELARCIEDLGFVGVEIGTRVGDRELSDPEFLPFFQAAGELGATVFIHPVDRTLDTRLAKLRLTFGMGMPTETAIAAAGLLVAGVLSAAPNVRICLAHAGGALPSVLPRVAFGQRIVEGVTVDEYMATRQARKLWSDSLTYDINSLRLALTRYGEDHVVLGTDYPFTAMETPAGAVLADVLSQLGRSTHDAIARGNALSLFPDPA
ncbi:amidohydrolase family protein [Actinophytocola sp.]|uniref:amidohydrolase family protein n=1 Tax=Actinophytocola sp. TaxID=1872138 RepID=UPI003D6C139F